jgi:hypothetical protein
VPKRTVCSPATQAPALETTASTAMPSSRAGPPRIIPPGNWNPTTTSARTILLSLGRLPIPCQRGATRHRRAFSRSREGRCFCRHRIDHMLATDHEKWVGGRPIVQCSGVTSRPPHGRKPLDHDVGSTRRRRDRYAAAANDDPYPSYQPEPNFFTPQPWGVICRLGPRPLSGIPNRAERDLIGA